MQPGLRRRSTAIGKYVRLSGEKNSLCEDKDKAGSQTVKSIGVSVHCDGGLRFAVSLGARRVDVLRVQRSEFDKGCQNIHTIVMGGRVGDPFIDLYSIDLYSIFIAVTANRDV